MSFEPGTIGLPKSRSGNRSTAICFSRFSVEKCPCHECKRCCYVRTSRFEVTNACVLGISVECHFVVAQFSKSVLSPSLVPFHVLHPRVDLWFVFAARILLLDLPSVMTSRHRVYKRGKDCLACRVANNCRMDLFKTCIFRKIPIRYSKKTAHRKTEGNREYHWTDLCNFVCKITKKSTIINNFINNQPLGTLRPIYRTGVKLPSRCPILYLFNKYPYWIF